MTNFYYDYHYKMTTFTMRRLLIKLCVCTQNVEKVVLHAQPVVGQEGQKELANPEI